MRLKLETLQLFSQKKTLLKPENLRFIRVSKDRDLKRWNMGQYVKVCAFDACKLIENP